MNEFIKYSILISLFYVYSGIGLTFLLCPKNFEKYSLYLSPFVGLSYLSYASWIFVYYSTFGSDVYAKWLLFPPIIFLIAAMILKKKRVGELLWPFQRKNCLLIIICVIIFLGISTPFLLKLNGLNTITMGNNDLAYYAAISKFMTKSSVLHYPLNIDGFFIETIKLGSHFAAYPSTSIPSSIFSIEPYKIQNLVSYLFYLFSLPLVFLIAIEIFKYNKNMAIVITLLSGISYHLIYINYQGFLGQVIGAGMFLSVFLLFLYPILNCDKFSGFVSYIPLTVVFTFGLFISYSPLAVFFLIPLFMYLFLVFTSTKFIPHLLNSLSFILLAVFAAFMSLPFLFLANVKELTLFANKGFGWDMPILSPEWVFGLIGNNVWMQPIPIIYRVVFSIPILLIIIYSLIDLFKKERNIFYLSISFISFILLVYIYFIIKEVSSLSFSGEGYKAYKLISYFIPIILLIGLSCFRNFSISSNRTNTKKQTFGMIFLVLLIGGNIWSASAIIYTNYYYSVMIKENIIDLQKITQMENISSINIVENQYWDQMWMYYFIFMDKKLYLQMASYYPASAQIGEWTLKAVNPYEKITIVNESNVVEINPNYFMVQNNLRTTLDKG